MAKPDNAKIDSLETILAEKRKLESYLLKLDERRAATPEHVWKRLRDEYLTKMTDLQVRASMEAESLGDGLRADEEALAEIDAKLAAVTEEKVEGELRAAVGEFEPKEWEKKLASLNATIVQIEKDRAAKSSSFERTRSLLTEARGKVGVGAPAAAASAPIPVPPSPAPPPPRASVPPVPPAAPPAVARSTPAGVPARAAPSAPVATPAPAAAAPSVPPPAAPPASAPSAVPASQPRSSTPIPVGEPPKAPATPPMQGGPSFDELAFLNSVVGRQSAQVKGEAAPAAPAAPEATRTSGSVPVTPPAVPPKRSSAQVPKPDDGGEAGSGPLGRPTPRTSQAIKTLKCQECGTLNYPTEWYCERCGGELAAL